MTLRLSVSRTLRPAVLSLVVASVTGGALAGCGSSASDDSAPPAKPAGVKDGGPVNHGTLNGGNVAPGTKKG